MPVEPDTDRDDVSSGDNRIGLSGYNFGTLLSKNNKVVAIADV